MPNSSRVAPGDPRGDPHGKHRGLSCSGEPCTGDWTISALRVHPYWDFHDGKHPRTLQQSQLSQQGCQLGSAGDRGDGCTFSMNAAPFSGWRPNPLAAGEQLVPSALRLKKGQRIALTGPYHQKPLKLVRTKIFGTGVTKVTVLKNAVWQSELNLIGLTVFFSYDQVRRDSIPDGNTNRSRYSGNW